MGQRRGDGHDALRADDRLVEAHDRLRAIARQLAGDAGVDEPEAPPWAFARRVLARASRRRRPCARRLGGPARRAARRARPDGRAQRPLGGVQGLLGRAGSALGRVPGRAAEREAGLEHELAGREQAQPLAEHRLAPFAHAAARQAPQQLAGVRGVPAGDRVADRRRRIAVARVPHRGAAVQARLELGLEPGQLGAQHRRDERVVTERDVAAVQRLQGRPGARQPLQAGGRAAHVEHRVAQRAAELAQQCGAAQEGLVVLVERRRATRR